MGTFLLTVALFALDTSGPPTRGKPLATAKIEYVDRAFRMVALAAGEPDGVNAGCQFIVVRRGRHGDKTVATGTFARYLGASHTSSKISVTKGSVNEFRMSDHVLVYRAKQP